MQTEAHIDGALEEFFVFLYHFFDVYFAQVFSNIIACKQDRIC